MFFEIVYLVQILYRYCTSFVQKEGKRGIKLSVLFSLRGGVYSRHILSLFLGGTILIILAPRVVMLTVVFGLGRKVSLCRA